jgi:hypothetical protein
MQARRPATQAMQASAPQVQVHGRRQQGCMRALRDTQPSRRARVSRASSSIQTTTERQTSPTTLRRY